MKKLKTAGRDRSPMQRDFYTCKEQSALLLLCGPVTVTWLMVTSFHRAQHREEGEGCAWRLAGTTSPGAVSCWCAENRAGPGCSAPRRPTVPARSWGKHQASPSGGAVCKRLARAPQNRQGPQHKGSLRNCHGQEKPQEATTPDVSWRRPGESKGRQGGN